MQSTEVEALELGTVVRGMARIGGHLNAPTDLRTQMEALCAETAKLLDCDRCSIMLWDGSHYRARYNWGNPRDIAEHFEKYRVRADAPLVQQIMDSGTFVLVNDASILGSVAEKARIESLVMAPLLNTDGAGLGFMTAEYNERVSTFDDIRAEAVLGVARMAQGAVQADRERRDRRRAEQTRTRLLEELAIAEDQERQRIGRRIQDLTLGDLEALTLGLHCAHTLATEPRLAVLLEALTEQGETVARTLKNMVQDIHPLTLEVDGLSDAVGLALARHSSESGWTFHFDNKLAADPPTTIAKTLYRIALHALQIISATGEATAVVVRLETDGGGTRLVVSDDGRGFDMGSGATNRLGLASMWERAEYAGGTCIVNSAEGSGTVITVWIPDTV